MRPTPFLVDTSALEQRRHSAAAVAAIERLFDDGQLATCEMVALEVLYSARNLTHRDEALATLTSYRWLAVTGDVMRRTIEVQGLLTARGHHRVALADLVIAATAELHRAVVLHYDEDYDVISAVTGQPTRWVIPRGSGG